MTTLTPRPSPNFNDRAANVDLAYVVLHYTDMPDAAQALARLCDPAAEVSAHYLIAEDGAIAHLVDEKYRAWHAGHSFWRGQRDLNSASIGIELANPGHSHGYVPFPAAQIAALEQLLREIVARHDLDPMRALLAHSDIAPARKQDPGSLFPWRALAERGLGLWPVPHPEETAPADATETQALLSDIGYDIADPAAALRAFCRRFDTESLPLLPGDMTTLPPQPAARLRAVRRQWGA